MDIELGGFAEYLSDFDGTEEEFNAFNYCLACDYVSALYEENFEEVGEVDGGLFYTILEWYNYTPELNNKEEVEALYYGTYVTCKGRTIIDAVLDKRYSSLAYEYLNRTGENRVYSPKLVLTCLLVDEKYPIKILYESQEDLDEKLEELYSLIEEEYKSAKDKKEFLTRLHNNLHRIRIKTGVTLKPINDKYNWTKALINQEYK